MSELVEYKGYEVPQQCVGCPRLEMVIEEGEVDIALAQAEEEEDADNLNELNRNILRLYDIHEVTPEDPSLFEIIKPSGLGIAVTQMSTRAAIFGLTAYCKGYRKKSILSSTRECSSSKNQ